MKVYVHYEPEGDEAHDFTCFTENCDMTAEQCLQWFVGQYQQANGEALDYSSAALCTERGKRIDPAKKISVACNHGDDLFVSIQRGTGSSVSAAKQISPGAPKTVPAPARAPPAPFKFYMHFDNDAGMEHTHIVHCDQAMTISEALHGFMQDFEQVCGLGILQHSSAVVTDSEGRVLDHGMSLYPAVSNGDDLFVAGGSSDKAQPEASSAGVTEQSSVISASQAKAGDQSYYYWNRTAPQEERAPKEAPKSVGSRTKKVSESLQYTTISAYSFENSTKFVKVYISLKGVGALPKESVASSFQDLSFSLTVMNLDGKNYRFQVPKLSESISPSECTVTVKPDRLFVKLRKVKEDYHWYELHKTKGIGED